jgi:hypothetical protein
MPLPTFAFSFPILILAPPQMQNAALVGYPTQDLTGAAGSLCGRGSAQKGNLLPSKMKGHPEMCMKTKRARCQVPGARCQGAHPDPEIQAGEVRAVRSEKTTFQAGMCMKTKDAVRSQESRTICHRQVILAPDSWLLTPVLQEMQVHPEMLLKTKDRENGTRENGTRGMPILPSALQERWPPWSGARMRR